jgi:carbon monoxide dehydrogenase subunit G
MIIRDSFVVPAPRDAVADFILDVESVKECVPGVGDVREVADDEYESTLRIQLGPIGAAFQGTLTLDRSAAPAQLRAEARGKDRSTGSVAAIEATAELVEVGAGETRVDVEADITIRGRLGQFGTGLIESTAKEIIGQFAACVTASLEGGSNHPPPQQQSLERTMAKGLIGWLKMMFKDVLRRLRGSAAHQEMGTQANDKY